MHNKSAARRGVTLVEVVISIGILALAFYTLMSVLGNVTFKNVDSQQLLKATFLAERAMEEFTMQGKDWNTDYVTRETQGFDGGGDFANFSNRIDVKFVELSDLTGTATLPTSAKRIEVVVTAEGLTIPVKLTTIKTKYNP